MSVESYDAVVKKFEEKRIRAQEEAENRKASLRAKSPEYAEADKKIALLGIELLRIVQDISSDHSKEILKIKEKSRELHALRKEILGSMGYDDDYVLPHYECADCEDTGFIGDKMCACFVKAVRTENYLSSGLGKALIKQRFENFDLSLYPADERENMRGIFEYCKEYAEKFTAESPSLLFIGGTGLGKTHLSSSLAIKILDKGFNVVYDTAQNIFSAYEKNRFVTDDSATSKYTDCDLLIIDDLGAEMNSAIAESTLYNILNSRNNSELPTVINTNLSPADMRSKYDSRIISRLFGQFAIMKFTGKDIRMQKLLEH